MITVSATNRYMTQTDYMSWRMEADPILRSTIVAVAVLDRVPDWPRFVDMMERGTKRVPIFRRKVVTASVGVAPPRWVEDPDFDLTWHVRRCTLTEPGGWDGVLNFARTTGMAAFDKERPLWEFTVLDGLGHHRAALVMKVHHCLTDGVGGMQIAREIVDFTREGTVRADDAEVVVPDDGRRSGPIDGLAWYRDMTGRIVRGVSIGMVRGGEGLIRRPADSFRRSVDVVASTMRLTRPVRTTLSPVMRTRTTRRRFAVLEAPLEPLGRAAESAGGSLNDGFLAAILLGMAKYHRVHGAEIPALRVTLPISLRTDTDPLGGNRITLARFALPTNIEDPAQLIREVHAVVESWRREPAIALSSHIAGALNLLPPSLLGNMLEHVDLVASNVVGSPVPLFMAGSQIVRYYAFSPTLGSALNVTLMSYTSQCCVGINADLGAVPDLETLTDSLADGFRAVLALCSPAPDTAIVSVP